MPLLIDAAGWLGPALLLGAYLLTSLGRLDGKSAAYQALNCAGAGCAAVNVWWHGALPVATFEIAWSLIGLVAWFRLAAVRGR